jgi:hypothetical protein
MIEHGIFAQTIIAFACFVVIIIGLLGLGYVWGRRSERKHHEDEANKIIAIEASLSRRARLI